jgi:hypothetical protein
MRMEFRKREKQFIITPKNEKSLTNKGNKLVKIKDNGKKNVKREMVNEKRKM